MSLLYLLQLLVGFFGLVLIALPFSQNLKNVNYKSIGIGIIFQIVLAILLLKVPLIVDAFKFLGDGVIALQKAIESALLDIVNIGYQRGYWKYE